MCCCCIEFIFRCWAVVLLFCQLFPQLQHCFCTGSVLAASGSKYAKSSLLFFFRNPIAILRAWLNSCVESLSLHFNGYFSRWTCVSQCLLKLWMMEVVVTTGAVSCAKLQSNHHQQHPTFYGPDALPVTQPTASAQKGKNPVESVSWNIPALTLLVWRQVGDLACNNPHLQSPYGSALEDFWGTWDNLWKKVPLNKNRKSPISLNVCTRSFKVK